MEEDKIEEYEMMQQHQKNLQKQKNYEYEDYGEGESSACSWSYWFRKEQGKGGIEELLAMNNVDPNDSQSHSFHSSILHENKNKYSNIRELRRLHEVLNSDEKN